LGGSTLSQGPTVQFHHHLAPQRKLRTLKLKYEALEISEVGGPLKEKCLYITVTLDSFSKQDISITTAVGGPFESKVAYLYITVAVEPL